MKIKTKRQISIVDIIIIVALLAAAVATGIGIFKGIGTGGDRVTVRYVIEVDPIDSDFTSKVSEGNGIYSYSDGEKIGTVSAIASSQAYHTGTDSQGAVVSSPIEGQSVLHITATAEAVSTDTGYTVGSTIIGIGRKLEIRLPELFCIGKCVSIEVIE